MELNVEHINDVSLLIAIYKEKVVELKGWWYVIINGLIIKDISIRSR